MTLGRPPAYETPEEFDSCVQEYFKLMAQNIKPATISGLAYHLGFESRQSFYDYENKPKFAYTVKRARFAIENHYEEALMGRNFVGAIFALKNLGWKDKQEVENTGTQKVEVVWDKSILPPTNTD